MSKEIDLIKCIINEIDDNLYSDFGANPCIRYTSNLKKLLLTLNTPEVRHFFGNCNNQAQQITDLEAKLAESEKEIASLEVCLLENKNNMKEMQGFKIGEDEYDLTDENARNDLRDYIQEFEKVSKRIYKQKEYAEKILRMSTHEEHQEILQLKQQLAEKEKYIEEQEFAEYKEMFYATQELKEDCELKILKLEKQCEKFAQSQNQTAVAELEKVKEYWLKHEDVGYYIDQQIKSLKGEK